MDAHLRTSQKHIYAIGDVTDRLNLTPVATAEGHALADTLFGKHPAYDLVAKRADRGISTPPLATVGLTEEQAAAHGPVDVYVSKFTPMRHTLSGRARRSVMKLVVDQATRRCWAHICWARTRRKSCRGLPSPIVTGATKADFDRAIGIHPTAAEEFVTMRTRTRVAGVARAAE